MSAVTELLPQLPVTATEGAGAALSRASFSTWER